MRVGRLWLAWAIGVIAVTTCAAQQMKIIEKDGHISPVRAKLTFPNNRTREVVVAGIGSSDPAVPYFPHNFFVRTEGGASKRELWIDSLAVIKGLDRIRSAQSEFVIVLKDGSEVSAMFVEGYPFPCNSYQEVTHSDRACSALMIVNQDGGHERIDMRQLKSVEFLTAPKKDKAGNGMFDTWRYSPFTGERLSDNEGQSK